VLIAEDEANIAELLSFVLDRAGYDVDSVPDGEAALRRLRKDPPDLLLLDAMMPGMNGFEVLRHMRTDELLRSLPVIVLTAKTQEHDRRMAQEMGAQGYITKPFSNREVVEEIQRLIAG
jgi:DNA-binding response OmpR family regulator